MRKILPLLLCGTLVISSVSCTAITGVDSVPSETAITDEQGNYVFNPHVYASIYEENYDQATKESFFSFCDAVLAGEEEFDCPDNVTFFNITETISRQCMPLSYYVDYDDNPVHGGKGHIVYTIPKDEYLSKVETFKDVVSSMLEDCVKPGYDDVDKALSFYQFFEDHYIYDHGDTDNIALSSCRLFMEQKGICQEIAPAYAYMMLQAGVDCFTCGALNEVNDAHEWVIAKLDGKYYHIDPTWTISNPGTLAYFGMTADRRTEEGGWLQEFFNFGGANIFDTRGEYGADDTRFEPLWDAFAYEIDLENNTIRYYSMSDGSEQTFQY